MNEGKTADQMDTNQTFTKSISWLIYFNRIFGINLHGSNTKYYVLYKFLYTIQVIFSVCGCLFAFVRSDMRSGNINVLVISLRFTVTCLVMLIIKSCYGAKRHQIAVLIKKTDDVLRQLNGHQRPLLAKMTTTYKWILIVPTIVVTVHLTFVAERLNTRVHYDFGSELYRQLNENYKIDLIYNVLMAPFNYAFAHLGLITLWIECWSVSFALDQLADSQILAEIADVTDCKWTCKKVVKFIKVHRKICKLCHQMNSTFYILNVFNYGLGLALVLPLARNVAVSKEGVSWATLAVIATVLGLFHMTTLWPSQVNRKLEQSLNQLMQQKLHNAAKNPIVSANLLTKLELYATHMTLDKPWLTVGNVVKYEAHLLITFLSFMLCYTFVLYDK